MWGSISIAVVVVAALIGIPYLIWSIDRGIDDAYALWGAAEMVVEYMDTHEGKWPQSWDDLKDQFEAGGGRVGGWSYDQYQSRVVIDFDADPESLRRQALDDPEATFDVIRPRYWTGVYFEGARPDEILGRYFRGEVLGEE